MKSRFEGAMPATVVKALLRPGRKPKAKRQQAALAPARAVSDLPAAASRKGSIPMPVSKSTDPLVQSIQSGSDPHSVSELLQKRSTPLTREERRRQRVAYVHGQLPERIRGDRTLDEVGELLEDFL